MKRDGRHTAREREPASKRYRVTHLLHELNGMDASIHSLVRSLSIVASQGDCANIESKSQLNIIQWIRRTRTKQMVVAAAAHPLRPKLCD